jgi:hypothetical protein
MKLLSLNMVMRVWRVMVIYVPGCDQSEMFYE